MKCNFLFKNIAFILCGGALLGCSDTHLKPLEQASLADIPSKISVEISNYTPLPGGVLRDIFVRNYSVDVSRGMAAYNTSRDTLADSFKANDSYYGFSPGGPNSANPFFSDLLIFSLGVKSTLQNTLSCNGSG